MFDPKSLDSVAWLADLLDAPDDFRWPRQMSPPHPAAVGSYGPEAEEWMRVELRLTLRHWQRLALRMQLAHDAAGELVYTTILESTPRRAGKSLKMAATAQWRTAHAEQFGETQLVLLSGKDLAICLEHHRKSWNWARERGWKVLQKNGQEEIENVEDGSRWLVRGRNSVYGYDVTYGLLDECWDLAPEVCDEGMEPALLERLQGQLHLTSTAHRKATPLMRRRINAALAGIEQGEVGSTLLLLWCAPPDIDITDIEAFRAASPYWSPAREQLITDRVERALRGEVDPEAEDLNPVAGLLAQYANLWPSSAAKALPGESVFDAETWAELNGYAPDGPPDVAAVENWFNDGYSVALATRLPDGTVGVTVKDFGNLASAGEFAASCGARTVLAGKALAAKPELVGSTPVAQLVRLALVDLERFVKEAAFRHDGSPELVEQALALRRLKPQDGAQRIVSDGRMDALKAVSFAVDFARQPQEAPMIWV